MFLGDSGCLWVQPIWHEICRTPHYADDILTRRMWNNLSKIIYDLRNQPTLEGGWSFDEVTRLYWGLGLAGGRLSVATICWKCGFC